MLLTAQTHCSIRMPEIANVGLTLIIIIIITTTTTAATFNTTIIKVPLVLH